MYPVLFEIGGISVYSYGFMIALGVVAGISYMFLQGKKEVGLTFDQANSLFLLIFIAAFVGGKLFLFFEEPSKYITNPGKLLAGRGFVFYGSFLLAIPTMLWYFKKQKLDTYKMLDVMAVVTCLVHLFGRLGCFMAGCCYGLPTSNSWGVVFSDPLCQAVPKGVLLHPTQLYESFYIFLVMLFLLYMRGRRKFYGQLFLLYLMLYAIGRSVLELFRGDEARGYVIGKFISHSQFIALLILIATLYVYSQWSKGNVISIDHNKNKKGA
jgi:phosphatidylglycerol:prolipoprotein diacylglycerol transferase